MVWDSEFGVQCLGFRVWVSGFGVQFLRFRVWGSGFEVLGLDSRVWVSVFGVQCLGFRVWGSGFRVRGSGFRVWGLGFRVWGLGCWVGSLGESRSHHAAREGGGRSRVACPPLYRGTGLDPPETAIVVGADPVLEALRHARAAFYSGIPHRKQLIGNSVPLGSRRHHAAWEGGGRDRVSCPPLYVGWCYQ